jgi:hypothetical protein
VFEVKKECSGENYRALGFEADASSAAAPPPADDAGVLNADASEPSSILTANDEKANRRKVNELAKKFM